MKQMIAMLLLCGSVGASLAGSNVNWNVTSGDWSTPGNWNPAAKPTNVDTAQVNNAGTATISTPGEACARLNVASVINSNGTVTLTTGGDMTVLQSLYLGNAGGASGTFNHNDGALTVNGTLTIAASSSGATGRYYLAGGQLTTWATTIGLSSPKTTGYLYQSGGFNVCTGANGFSVGRNSGGGRFELSGGVTTITGTTFWVGAETNSVGTVLQTGGTNNIYYGGTSQLTLGYYGNSTGSYTLVDGLLYCTANSVNIGNSGVGTFTQSGGVFRVDSPGNGPVWGQLAGGVGTYNLMGGTCVFTNSSRTVTFGNSGQGILNMGNAIGTGIITQPVANARNLVIATTNATSRGTVHGWGTIAMTGFLFNNGRIVADGYGSARDLDCSSFTAVSNQLVNPSSNGWFAVNKGRLVLPVVQVKSNSASAGYSWGDNVTNTTLSLVNSARLTLSNARASALSGSLLATDRADVPARLRYPVGVWQFSGGTFATAALAFRYDDAAAAAAGTSESALRVWQWTGSRWADVTQGIDTGTHTVTTQSATTLGIFAVAPSVLLNGTTVFFR